MARPQKKIDGEQVRAMAAIGLSVKEIAAVLGCSHDTIARRFKHQLDSGWENMRASLKRAQYEAAG